MKRSLVFITVLCFLFSNISFALDSGQTYTSQGNINLSPPLFTDDIADGTSHAKSMALAMMQLQMYLKHLGPLSDIKDLEELKEQFEKLARQRGAIIDNIRIEEKEATIYEPAKITLFHDQIECLSEEYGIFSIPVMVIKGSTNYYYTLIFSTTRTVADYYPITPCHTKDESNALKEEIKLKASLGVLPKREETGENAIMRYIINNEQIIDPWIADHMEDAGNYIEFSQGQKTQGTLADFILKILNSDQKFRAMWEALLFNDPNPTRALEKRLYGKRIVFIKIKDGEKKPVIFEDGKPVTVGSHASNHAIYIFIDEKDFDEAKKQLSSGNHQVDPELARRIAMSFAHELGVTFGHAYEVTEDGRIINDMDRLYKEASGRLPASVDIPTFSRITDELAGLDLTGSIRTRLSVVDLDKTLNRRDYAREETGKVKDDPKSRRQIKHERSLRESVLVVIALSEYLRNELTKKGYVTWKEFRRGYNEVRKGYKDLKLHRLPRMAKNDTQSRIALNSLVEQGYLDKEKVKGEDRYSVTLKGTYKQMALHAEVTGNSDDAFLYSLLSEMLDADQETRSVAVSEYKRMYPELAEEIDAYFAALPISGHKILEKAKELGKPVLACNIDNGELSAIQIRAMMQEALRRNAIIMFEVGPDALKTYADGKPHLPEYCAREAYKLYKETGKVVIYAVHLDHNQIKAKDFYEGTEAQRRKALQKGIDRARFALALGFTSFATDTSTLTELERRSVRARLANVIETGKEILTAIYEGARALGIEVGNEGEVGDIGKEISTVEEAVIYYKQLVSKLKPLAKRLGKDFSKEPLIDIIALNIGTAHGYDFGDNDQLKPYTHGRINVERAKEVHRAFRAMGLNIGIALHGFSGTPIRFAPEFINTGIAKVNINTDWQAIIWKVLYEYYPELYRKMFCHARVLAFKDAKKNYLVTKDESNNLALTKEAIDHDLAVARNRIMFGFARKVFRDKAFHPLLEEIALTLTTGKKKLRVAEKQYVRNHKRMVLTFSGKAEPVTAGQAVEMLTGSRVRDLMKALKLQDSAEGVTTDRARELRLQDWQLRRLATILHITVHETEKQMGKEAAKDILEDVEKAIATRGKAVILFASAPSQHSTWEALIKLWNELPEEKQRYLAKRIIAFHMDEYLGLRPDAPQAFGKTLARELFSKLGIPRRNIHYFNSKIAFHEASLLRAALVRKAPKEEIERLVSQIKRKIIPHIEALADKYKAHGGVFDITIGGVGKLPHVAFNDPHVADFLDKLIIKLVELDDESRIQQVVDEEFVTLVQVPTHALTFTLPPIFSSRSIYIIVPRAFKAESVRRTLDLWISEQFPSSGLRQPHVLPKVRFYLDKAAASKSEVAKLALKHQRANAERLQKRVQGITTRALRAYSSEMFHNSFVAFLNEVTDLDALIAAEAELGKSASLGRYRSRKAFIIRDAVTMRRITVQQGAKRPFSNSWDMPAADLLGDAKLKDLVPHPLLNAMFDMVFDRRRVIRRSEAGDAFVTRESLTKSHRDKREVIWFGYADSENQTFLDIFNYLARDHAEIYGRTEVTIEDEIAVAREMVRIADEKGRETARPQFMVGSGEETDFVNELKWRLSQQVEHPGIRNGNIYAMASYKNVKRHEDDVFPVIVLHAMLEREIHTEAIDKIFSGITREESNRQYDEWRRSELGINGIIPVNIRINLTTGENPQTELIEGRMDYNTFAQRAHDIAERYYPVPELETETRERPASDYVFLEAEVPAAASMNSNISPVRRLIRKALDALPNEFKTRYANRALVAWTFRLEGYPNIREVRENDAMVFSNALVFEHAAGIVLPKLAESGVNVAVIVNNDEQRDIIRALNEENKLPKDKEIVPIERIEEVQSAMKATGRSKISKAFYLRGENEEELMGVENIVITAAKIIQILRSVTQTTSETFREHFERAIRAFKEAA